MRSSTLLNWIKKRAPAKFLACFFAALILCQTRAMAAEQPQATITAAATAYTEAGLLVDVTVSFADASLYNEQVYLSYHIVDETGEMLAFENQRLPLSLDKDNSALVTVSVNDSTVPETPNGTAAKVQFDLVDQQNVYWFSLNNTISFQGAEVAYDSAQVAGAGIRAQIFAAVPIVLNALLWIVFALLLFRYMRKKNKSVQDKDAAA